MLHIGRNILSLLISRILAAVILLLIYTHLIQYLGPTVAGEYGLMAAYLTIFSFFIDLGMQSLVIKRISEDKSNTAKYYSNYFGIQFVLGLGFVIILYIIATTAHYPAIVRHSLYITGISMLLSSMTMPFLAVINAYQKLGIMAQVNFVNSVINASMMLLAIIFRQNIFFLAFIPGLVAIFDIIVYWIYVERKFAHLSLKFDFAFWKEIFLLNLPFMWLTIFSIYNRIDSLLLPHLRNFTEAGYYSAAYKFWDTLAYLPAVVGASLYPYFADRLIAGAKEQVKEVLETYTRYMIALAIPASIGAYFLSVKILEFFARSFVPAAPALWILVVAVSVLFIYTPVNSVVISQKTKLATKITGLNLLFNLIANLIFIPKFGFVAAAVITLISECIQLVGYTIIVKRTVVDFNYLSNFIKPLIAGIVMGLLLVYFKNLNLWYSILLGAIAYSFMLAVLRFFNKHDWELLKASINLRRKLEPDIPPTQNL